MNETFLKWAFLSLFLFTVPSVFFLLVALALLPVIVIFLMMFQDVSMLIFSVIHCVIYIPIYYFLAGRLAKLVFRIPSPSFRMFTIAALFIVLISVAFLPIYGGGHNTWKSENIIGVTKWING
jgi:hypothetical protein